MCTNPQKLPTGRIVRCGKCRECRQAKSLSWKVRNYFEAKRIQRLGGFMVYVTLTYNNDNVPKFSPMEYLLSRDTSAFPLHFDVDKFKDSHISACREYLCFRHSDLQKYLKAIRQQFVRDGIGDIRYFFASEFGGDYDYMDDYGHRRHATHRPHYHGLFFVNESPDNFERVRDVIASKWKFGDVTFTQDPNDNTAPFGLVKLKGKTDSALSDFLSPAMYVAKYVGKESYDPYLYKLRMTCENLLSAVEITPIFGMMELASVRSFFDRSTSPRVFASVNFGGDVVNDPKSQEYLESSRCVVPLYDKESHTIVDKVVPLPKNVIRKRDFICQAEEHFDKYGNPVTRYRYILTEDGNARISVREQLHENCLDKDIQTFIDTLSLYDLDRYTPILNIPRECWSTAFRCYLNGDYSFSDFSCNHQLQELLMYYLPILAELFEKVLSYSTATARAAAAVADKVDREKAAFQQSTDVYGRKRHKAPTMKYRK